MFLGRCTFPRFCAKWCSNSVAHGISLSSSRSFNLYPKLTQLAPFFEINSTVFWASDLAACEASINWILLGLLYLKAETQIFLIAISFIPFGSGWLEEHLKWNRHDELSLVFDIKVWKWNETASDREQLHKILAALWSEAGWWALNIKVWVKVSMLNCQTKKLTDAPFQGFVHMKLKHQRPVTEGKKVTNLLCVGTVWCGWMRAINFWNELWICQCCMSTHQDRWQTWLSELSDIYS